MVASYDANANAWRTLYLRGSAIYLEPQSGGLLNATGGMTQLGWMTQIIPTAQNDPGNFAGTGSAHYIYFDPATKKLVLRYHEGGVAYRNYYLKEGDQSTSTVFFTQAAVSRTLDTTPRYLTNTFAIPAGAMSARIQATMTCNGAQLFLWISFGGTTGTAGNSNPTGEPELGCIVYGTYPSGAVTVDATITKLSDNSVSISGSYKIGAGAWTVFYENSSVVARGINNGYVALSARVQSGSNTLVNVAVTAITYY
jgi:hypothetical protein